MSEEPATPQRAYGQQQHAAALVASPGQHDSDEQQRPQQVQQNGAQAQAAERDAGWVSPAHPAKGKVVHFVGDSAGKEAPLAWKSGLAAAAGGGGAAGGKLGSPGDQVELHVGATAAGYGPADGSADGLPEGEEVEEEFEEEGEEVWYYGAEQVSRGFQHVENQLFAWVVTLAVVAIALNIGVSGERQAGRRCTGPAARQSAAPRRGVEGWMLSGQAMRPACLAAL